MDDRHFQELEDLSPEEMTRHEYQALQRRQRAGRRQPQLHHSLDDDVMQRLVETNEGLRREVARGRARVREMQEQIERLTAELEALKRQAREQEEPREVDSEPVNPRWDLEWD